MNSTQNGQPNPYAPPKAAVHDVVDSSINEPAGRGTRLAAAIIDGIVIGALVGAPAGAGQAIQVTAIGPGYTLGIILGLVGFAVWAYLTIRFVKANGQTIAKKMLGIKVVRSDGSPISLARIFWLRNVVNGIPGAIPVVGYLYVLVDSLLIFGQPRQCLHDKIADTIVVKA